MKNKKRKKTKYTVPFLSMAIVTAIAFTTASVLLLSNKAVPNNTQSLVPAPVSQIISLDSSQYKPNIITENGAFSTSYVVQMPTTIQSPIYFRELNAMLRAANRADTVEFRLSGFGGSVQTTLEILNSIRASKAKVIMTVTAPVYSAHAIIAVSGDVMVLEIAASLMFHLPQTMSEDKQVSICKRDYIPSNPFEADVTAILCDSMRDVYAKKLIKFLSYQQFKDVMSGEDVIVSQKEVVKRVGTNKVLLDKNL